MALKYPAIPEPTTDTQSLRDSVLSLKQAFEILTGQRGDAANSALNSSDIAHLADADTVAANTAAIAANTASIATHTTALAAIQPYGFHATKNGTDQVIGSTALTKVTFTTELFDVGSYYDAPNSKWTPPAGLVKISVSIWYDSGAASVFVYKNGSQFKGSFEGSASNGVSVSFADNANGTDYYEVYTNISASTFTVKGNTIWTHFSGTRL